MNKSPPARYIEPTDFVPPPSGGTRSMPFRPLWIAAGIAVCFLGYLLFFLVTAVSLRLVVLPQEAAASLSGGAHLALGDRLILRPGTYELRVQAPGYRVFAERLEIQESLTREIELTPLPGTLLIAVTPAEIEALEVVVGGRRYAGENPLSIDELEPGTYQIEVDAPLYAARSSAVTVQGRNQVDELHLEMQPAWAEVRLGSVPAGAGVVSAEGDELGSTPLTTRLEQGVHNLRFSLPGYQQASLRLELQAGQGSAPAPLVLLPVESQLSLVSNPVGAAVVLNGEFRGETPLQLDLLPDRDYQLRLFKAGYATAERSIRLERGEQRDLAETLDPVTGRVAINVTPSDAEIWVDGRLRATGSTELELNTVNHQIEIRKAGYQAQTRTFLPLQDQRQVVSVNLMTEEEAIWAAIPARYQLMGLDFRLFRDPDRVQLGTSRREPDRRVNEVEWVAQLERAFYVSAHEVTNAQFRQFQSSHSSGNFSGISLDGENQPVVSVTWQEAALYCNWLSQQQGLEPFYQTQAGFVSGTNPEATGYRLLTEAEWTWLASVTASQLVRRYPWGNEDLPQAVENFAGNEVASLLNFTLPTADTYPVSAPVGRFPPNDKGLYDLGGNVAEYLHDWYSADAPSAQMVIDPLGPNEGEYHVIRGASWSRGYLPQLRLAYRDYDAVGRNDVGFRVARYAR